MRHYAKVTSSFWLGHTGRQLRGQSATQLVALYLMTSPHANMIGVFHCPALYISHETGLSMDEVSDGLRRLKEADFCTVDADRELIFVHEMAHYQIGTDIKPADKRLSGVQHDYAGLPEGPLKRAFFARYAQAFYLEGLATRPHPDDDLFAEPVPQSPPKKAQTPGQAGLNPENISHQEAPSKPLPDENLPLRSLELELELNKEQELEQEREQTRARIGTQAGQICKAMKAIGLMHVNPAHPDLLALIASGVSEQTFAYTAQEAEERQKGFAWVLATIRGRLHDPQPRCMPGYPSHRQRLLSSASDDDEIDYGPGGLLPE
ncbi:hypothetical protein HZU77_006940 [Neisseriaceae bacterium TC5R-5]|nr:hypothetical protein [Neisseriaceae bacterium TC5R-5]